MSHAKPASRQNGPGKVKTALSLFSNDTPAFNAYNMHIVHVYVYELVLIYCTVCVVQKDN